MMKFATAAIVCSASLVLSSDLAQARCGCRKNCCSAPATCCAPAPTCAAPAPSCCAPAAHTESAPAVPAAPSDAAPPAPSAGTGYGNPSVAMDGRQSYRSYSYNPAPAPAAPMFADPTPRRSRAAWDNIGKADRKMLGYY